MTKYWFNARIINYINLRMHETLILLVAYCPDDVNVAVGNGIVEEGVPATVCWVSIYPPRRQEAA